MTVGVVTVAVAGTHTGSPASQPPRTAVSPGGTTLPGALAVAQSQPGAGQMSHPLVVKLRGWTNANSACVSAARAIADTQSAPANPGKCATPDLAATLPDGYTPATLRAYLRLGGTGAGQRVAIVDAFDNPYAAHDLATFSKEFGLPLPCGTTGKRGKQGCFTFASVHPFGIGGVDAGWALESDLDAQMVHAIAPKASITLVEAYDASTLSLFQAIGYAAALRPLPSVISNSWGEPEFAGETAGKLPCALAKTLCVFSAGDAGNPGQYPAYDPHVLSVGGTTLGLTASGKVRLEASWCCEISSGAGGGGVSQYEPRPSYQDGINPYQGRGIPDVSFDADPYTGVPVYDTFGLDGQAGWFTVGGTSVGAPAWAGIVAAVDQLRATAGRPPLAGAGFQAQRLIYSRAGRHAAGFGDITTGVDNLIECASPVQACRASPGYDEVTGWGSPRPGIDETLAGP
jgi:hypothetical protein